MPLNFDYNSKIVFRIFDSVFNIN